MEKEGDDTRSGRSEFEGSMPDEMVDAQAGMMCVTRRALLGGAGGLAVFALNPAIAAEDDPDLVVVSDDAKLSISVGTARWELDLQAVSDGTSVATASLSKDRIRVTLSARAGFRETSLPIRLHFERKPHLLGRRWHLSVEALSGSFRRSTEVPFVDFLSQNAHLKNRLPLGKAPASASSLPSITLSSDEASFFLKRITGASATSGQKLHLALLPDLTWHLATSSSDGRAKSYDIRLERAGMAMAVEGIRVGRVAPTEGPCRAARTGDVRIGALVLALVAVGGRSAGKAWPLGKAGRARAEVSLDSGPVDAAAERYPTAIDRRGIGEAVVIGAATGSFGKVRFLGDVPVTLPVASGDVMWARSSRASSPWQTKSVLVLPEKPFVATFPVGTVGLHGGGKIAPLQMTESAERKDRGSLKLSGEVSVTQIFRRVPGTDFSRLDVGCKVVRLVTPSLENSGGFIEVGGRAALARLPLDDAKLRIRRAADLLALGYRFSGIALHLDRDSTWFVPSGAAGDMGDQAEALLIVELPPQHVAEQVFYHAVPEKAHDDDLIVTNVFVDEVAIRRAVESRIARDMPDFDSNDGKRQEFRTRVEQELPKAVLEEKRKDQDYERFYTALKKKNPSADPDSAADRGLALQVMRELQDKDPEAKGGLPPLSQARLSGSTRVAFVVPIAAEAEAASAAMAGKKGSASSSPPAGSNKILAYNADALTDFSRFDMKVVRRAKYFKSDETTTSAIAELKAYGIEESAPLADAQDRWDARMARIRDLMAKPSDHETSIELPTRLMLSPDNLARWRTPKAPNSGRDGVTAVPLWRMQLDLEARTTPQVRAVWSPDFRADAFGGGGAQPVRGEYEGYRTAMDAYDRHELVALSSLHGLPVLPRQRADGGLEGGQFAPPPNFEIGGRDDGEKQAIYRPAALTVSELTLTTLGGSISLDTAFEPPAGVDHLRNAVPETTFSIERWRHNAVLGRDVSVEVVYKGFLFPLGHRCSLVKVTERVFLKGRGGFPTAYLVQRMFLRTGRPVKLFPALYHPDQGRRWPVNQVEVLTKRTPDIRDPLRADDQPVNFVHASGRITGLGSQTLSDSKEDAARQALKGLVFWPRIAGAARSEVIFNFMINESASVIRMPLMFVDNVAAHDPATVGALCRYYDSFNGSSGENPALIQHGGVARRYAEEKRRDSTSYETIDWTLSAEGRANSAGSGDTSGVNAYFQMDALMEGVDQPPFYPFVKKATIRVKQLEQLSGSGARPVLASYIEGYRLKGFEAPDENKQEAFLELEEGVPLSFVNTGDRSGGVAKPDVTIKALSRSQGPIGEASTRAEVSTQKVDFSHFNTIDPQVLFRDATLLGVKFGKLFGALDLAGLSHPKMNQYIDYTFVDGAQDRIAPALDELASLIDSYITRDWLIEVAGRKSNFKLRQALPRLDKALVEASERTKAVSKSLKGRTSGAAFEGGVELYEACQRLISEIDRIVEDPIAPLKANAQKLLLDLQTSVLGEITGQLQDAAGPFLRLLNDIRGSYAQLEEELKRRLEAGLDAAAGEWRSRVLAMPPLVNLTASAETAVVLAELLKLFVETLVATAKASTGVSDDSKALLLDFIDRTRFPAHLRQAYAALAARIDQDKPARGSRLDALRQQFAFLAASNTSLPYAYDRLASAMEAVYGLAERLAASAVLKPQDALDQILREVKQAIVTYVQATQDRLVGEIASACQSAAGALISLAIAELPVASLSSQGTLYCDISSEEPVVGSMAGTCQDIRSLLGSAATSLQRMRSLRDRVAAQPADTPQRAQLLEAIDGLLTVCARGVEFVRSDLAILFGKVRDAGEAWRKLNAAAGLKTIDELESWLRATSVTACSSFQVEAIEPWLAEIPRAAAEVGDAARAALEKLRAQIAAINVSANQLSRPEILDAAAVTVLDAERLQMELLSSLARLGGPISELLVSSTATFETISADAGSLRSMALAKAEEAVDAIYRAARGGFFERLFGSRPDDPRITVLADFDETIETAVSTLRDLKNPLAALAGEIDAALALAGGPMATRSKLEAIRQKIDVEKAIDEWVNALRTNTENVRSGLLAELRSTLRDVSTLEQVGFDLLKEPMARILDPAVDFMAHLYSRIEEVRDSLAKASKDQLGVFSGAVELDDTLYVGPIEAELDALARDRAKLQALAEAITRTTVPRDQIEASLSLFEKPSPVALVKQVIEAIETILRGDIGRFIDLEQLKNRVIEDTKDLIPAKVSLDYDLAMPIRPSPTVAEVFNIWQTVENGADPSTYMRAFEERAFVENGKSTVSDEGRDNTDLVIRTRTRVDILNGGKVTSIAEGYLRPFKVSLFGDTLNVVTMYFDGARFRAGSDLAGDFKIKLIDTKLGKQVEFLEKIQNWLNGGSGNGFKLKFLANPLGIEARYGFALPVISIGTVSFSNVSLQAGVVLPFEQGEALFRVALSSRDNPFLISAAPFGGGGHLALYANAESIVGFEASFEYGGVAAFGFGPMQGIGRLTTGFYVSKDSLRGATIQGHFFAGGSARVWIFGVAASLAVRMGQANGGQMCGSAVYSYSFSFGIDDIEFHVAVWRQEGKSFNAEETKSAHLAPRGPTRFAALTNSGVVSDAKPIHIAQATHDNGRAAGDRGNQYGVTLESRVFVRERRWDRYNAYFDTSLEPED